MAALLSEPDVLTSPVAEQGTDAFSDDPQPAATSALDTLALDTLEREALEQDALFASTAEHADEPLTAEEDAIWSASNAEPVLEGEDWTTQPDMQTADVSEFDPDGLEDDFFASADEAVQVDVTARELPASTVASPATPSSTPSVESDLDNEQWGDDSESVLLNDDKPAPAAAPSYISIEALMKELDEVPASEADEAPLNLEVGLDEFPDVLAGIDAYDVDSQGEFASKLDLAKAYLEMNDSEGARDLLEEIALQADTSLQQEANALLGKMKV